MRKFFSKQSSTPSTKEDEIDVRQSTTDPDKMGSSHPSSGSKSGAPLPEDGEALTGASAPPSANDSTRDPPGVLEEQRSSLSCYVGGINGICSSCDLKKMACNCQHCKLCGRYMLTFKSRHHCRCCWRAVCPSCSSHRRVNDFMSGSVNRTCDSCAAPRALLKVTTLSRGFSGDSSTTPSAFRWGLYMLSCSMEAPRECVNPTCANPFSYEGVCRACRLPTVATAVHEPRHVEAVEASMKAEAANLMSAAEKAAKETIGNSAYTSEEADALFHSLLPNISEEAAEGTSKGGAASLSRTALLSLFGISIANEAASKPGISQIMSELPYAACLTPTRATNDFSIFKAPGNTYIVAFVSTRKGDPKAIELLLSSRMTWRELWSSDATARDGALGRVVENAEVAKREGLRTCVAQWRVREGLMLYTTGGGQADALKGLEAEVVQLMADGADVVLSGHGMGGAVASWLTTRMLLEHTATAKGRLLCITFGAPIIGGSSLAQLIQHQGLEQSFQHYINRSDMVPRLPYAEGLLESGNTCSCASMHDGDRHAATAMDVSDAVVNWVVQYGYATSSPITTANEAKVKPASTPASTNHSPPSLLQRLRGQPAASSAAGFNEGTQVRCSVFSSEPDPAGDLFAASREPFDNDIRRVMSQEGETSCMSANGALSDYDLSRFVAAAYQDRQTIHPFGCYHLLWQPRGVYLQLSDSAATLALLSDRTNLRIELQDHLLTRYQQSFTECLHSAAPQTISLLPSSPQ